jgi:hypothetical protein
MLTLERHRAAEILQLLGHPLTQLARVSGRRLELDELVQ